jgi:DNA-binding transcriptional MerR regulator
MVDSNLQIHELAKKAGVSVRTIRYYIEEGLLPTPSPRGRYSVYSEDYLERIELIRILKERFLPLKQIRTRLDSLGAEEVRMALAQERAQLEAETHRVREAVPEGGDENLGALEYVNSLLKRQPGRSGISSSAIKSPLSLSQSRISTSVSQPTPQPAHAQRLFAPPSPQLSPITQAAPAQEGEVWERVRLIPGVELHIQKPVEEDNLEKLEQLKRFACQLFNIN